MVMLLAALATGSLYDMIELDGTPMLKATDAGMVLDLLEIKASPDGAPCHEAVAGLAACLGR